MTFHTPVYTVMIAILKVFFFLLISGGKHEQACRDVKPHNKEVKFSTTLGKEK